MRCTRCDRPICPECMRPASVGLPLPGRRRDRAARPQRPPRNSVGRSAARLAAVRDDRARRRSTSRSTWRPALPSPRGINNPEYSRLFQDWQLLPYVRAPRRRVLPAGRPRRSCTSTCCTSRQHALAGVRRAATSNASSAGGASRSCTAVSRARRRRPRSTPSAHRSCRSSARPARCSGCSAPAWCWSAGSASTCSG